MRTDVAVMAVTLFSSAGTQVACDMMSISGILPVASKAHITCYLADGCNY